MVIRVVEMLNRYVVNIAFLFYDDASIIRSMKCVCVAVLVHLSNFYTVLLNCM